MALHHRRLSLGDPPQREEGPGRAVARQQLEQPVHVARDPALERLPALARHLRGQREHLEVLLDVYGEVMAHDRKTVRQRRVPSACADRSLPEASGSRRARWPVGTSTPTMSNDAAHGVHPGERRRRNAESAVRSSCTTRFPLPSETGQSEVAQHRRGIADDEVEDDDQLRVARPAGRRRRRQRRQHRRRGKNPWPSGVGVPPSSVGCPLRRAVVARTRTESPAATVAAEPRQPDGPGGVGQMDRRVAETIDDPFSATPTTTTVCPPAAPAPPRR